MSVGVANAALIERFYAAFARRDAEVRDGLIGRHFDRFSLWRWSSMALGAKGALLGWLPPVRAAIRAQAANALAAYAAKSA